MDGKRYLCKEWGGGMKQKIIRKLQSKAGDSIAEVLIALLISSLALVMLASMISSSANMITKSKSNMDDYYSKMNALASSSNATVDITIQMGSVSETVSGVSCYVDDSDNETFISYK